MDNSTPATNDRSPTLLDGNNPSDREAEEESYTSQVKGIRSFQDNYGNNNETGDERVPTYFSDQIVDIPEKDSVVSVVSIRLL